MGILQLKEVSKTYPGEEILKGISLQLQPGEKAGLVGPNGSGKSTLLKIITGEIEADGGTVHIAGENTGYLPQEPRPPEGGTLRSLLEASLQHLLDMKKEIDLLEKEIASRSSRNPQDPELEPLLQRYGDLRDLFTEKGGYQVESRLQAVSRGLGFSSEELEKDMYSFSGGEVMRARLAALLLEEPELLLLDEPTNFLDMEGLDWLEKYLRDWKGTLIVVSHDRYFLDRVVERILLLEEGSLKSYPGNYSAFTEQREQEKLSRQRAYEKQQAIIKREQTLIREAKGDERSQRQARSRQKRLEKVKPVEEPAVHRKKRFRPGLRFSGRSGYRAITLEEVEKYYGSREVFSGLNLEIFWGDRLALLGPNGSGKTTLMKLIAGEEEPTSGYIRQGPSTRIAYFSQEKEQLNPHGTLLEEICRAGDLDLKQGRQHLGHYLFSGEDAFKKVTSLSSGEKSRLALARLALNEGNCLLMDEPTSHLDLDSLEELEQVLQEYPGTLLVISHDRYFLVKLGVNRVLELREGRGYSFRGSYAEYLQKKENEAAKDNSTVRENAGSKKEESKQHRQSQKQKARERQRKEKKLLQKQKELEDAISRAEAEIASLEKQLSDPSRYGDYRRVEELNRELEEAREQAAAYLKEWENVSLKLEESEQYDSRR